MTYTARKAGSDTCCKTSKFVKHLTVTQQGIAAELLSAATGLSKSAVKDCLNKGAVWLIRRGRKEQRLRRATFTVMADDRLSLYYDEAILSQPVQEPQCLFSDEQYSIWNKPAGMLSQGTRYGDHCSLLRFAQKAAVGKVVIHLVHRLDREAQGLVLLAHNSSAAAKFSALFRTGGMEKRYKAVVEGLLGRENETIRIEAPLDSKSATTLVTVIQHDKALLRSHLDINLRTGRYHQIRRHLSDLGYPLVGDLRYGGAKNPEGLQLKAYSLSFSCPFTGKKRDFRLP